MIAESKLKFPENSEVNRNFPEGKVQFNQIYPKPSILNLLFWSLTGFLTC